jgi:hypothetical protein
MVVARPRSPQPLLHGGPVALGQMLDHVAFLVSQASLDRRLAEDVADRLPERLGAVDHEQDPLLGVEAALDQIRADSPASSSERTPVRQARCLKAWKRR